MRAASITATAGGVKLTDNPRTQYGQGDDVAIDVSIRVAPGAMNVTQTVTLGGTAAEAAGTNGFPLSSDDRVFVVTLEAGEALYAAGTAKVSALVSRRA